MSLKHIEKSNRLHGVTLRNVPLILRGTRRVLTRGQRYQGVQQDFLLYVCSTPDIVEICLFTTCLAKCLNIPISSDQLYGVAVSFNGSSSWLWSIFSCQSTMERRVALELKATQSPALSRLHVGYVIMKSCCGICQRPCPFGKVGSRSITVVKQL